MYALLTAESEDIINKLFNNIQMADENTSGLYLCFVLFILYINIYVNFINFLLDWIKFYHQKWVIASLNKCMSKINNEIWVTSPDNINVVEAAHALSN